MSTEPVSDIRVVEDSGEVHPPVPTKHHKIVIVGGGTGGASVAARLCRELKNADVAVVEPSETHDYQPLWTLVGAGVVSKEKTRHHEIDVLPKKAAWIRQSVIKFNPSGNSVTLDDGSRITYDYLVVAAGIKLLWDKIKGLSEDQLGKDGICSNYGYDACEGTWKTLQEFKGGTAIFTFPPVPIKCAGAPQKIMYLADDYFRRRGIRDKSRVIYAAASPAIFGVKAFQPALNKVIERKGIETVYKHKLVELKPSDHVAIFEYTETGEMVEMEYDMIHVVPPQGPPDVIRDSPLANEAGWVNVDKFTLQSPDYPNVFSLGDASSLPTSKTGAAVRKESPVLVHNLLATMNGESPDTFKKYDGYASCPLVTGYGKLILAEFDYDGNPEPSFPFDQTKERWSMYQFKRYGLPAMYWHGMMKGRV